MGKRSDNGRKSPEFPELGAVGVPTTMDIDLPVYTPEEFI